MESVMTENVKNFVNEQIAKSKDWYETRLKDEGFVEKRIEQMTDMATRVARKSTDIIKANEPPEKMAALKEEIIQEELELQMTMMRDLFNENAEERRERMRTLSSFDLEDFKEANFELVREEMKLVAHFNEFIMNKSQNSIYAALDALEEELMEDECACENEDCDCNDHFRIFPINPDQTVN